MSKVLGLLAGVAVLAIGTLPALAGTMNVFLSQDNGAVTSTTIGAPGQSTFTNSNQTFGAFNINNITGSTTPTTIEPVLLSSNTLDVQTTGLNTPHILDIYITASDLTSPIGAVSMFSGLTNVTLSPGWIVTLSTLYSAANALFAGTQVATATFIGADIPTTFSSNFLNSLVFGPGLFSLTGHYHIVTDGIGQANSGISIQAVPEVPLPGAVWLFGSILALVGGVKAFLRRRQTLALA